MAQRLKALAALPKDWGSTLRIYHVIAHNYLYVNSIPWGTLFWPPQAPGMKMVHQSTFGQNTHKKVKCNLKNYFKCSLWCDREDQRLEGYGSRDHLKLVSATQL